MGAIGRERPSLGGFIAPAAGTCSSEVIMPAKSKSQQTAADAKRELVDFLIERAFKPVLEAKPDGRSEAERQKLKRVQDATRAEIERYRNYDSAEDVVTNFRRDLDSPAAKKVHAELKELHLPTLNDIRDEFEAKAAELGVEARS